MLEHSEHLVESAQHKGVEQGSVDADADLHQAEYAADGVVTTELLRVVVHVLQDLHATGEFRSHGKLKGQGSAESDRIDTERLGWLHLELHRVVVGFHEHANQNQDLHYKHQQQEVDLLSLDVWRNVQVLLDVFVETEDRETVVVLVESDGVGLLVEFLHELEVVVDLHLGRHFDFLLVHIWLLLIDGIVVNSARGNLVLVGFSSLFDQLLGDFIESLDLLSLLVLVPLHYQSVDPLANSGYNLDETPVSLVLVAAVIEHDVKGNADDEEQDSADPLHHSGLLDIFVHLE